MPSTDEQIAQSRAQKKKRIVTGAIVSVFVCVLIGVVATLMMYLPVTSTAPTDRVSTPSDESAPSAAASTLDRKALQAALNNTRQRLTDVLDIPHLEAWQPKTAAGFQHDLDSAFQAYGASKYPQAQTGLTDLNRALDEHLAAFQTAYQQPYQQAANAFADDQLDQAAQLNAQALRVNGDYAEALALQQRIDVYHQVTDLYEQARVGKVEGNTQKQQRAYQQIVALDPARTDAKAALAEVNQTITRARFDQALAVAIQAVDDNNFKEAQRALTQAAGFDKNRPELATVQAKIDKAVKAQGLQSLEQRITVFVAADEWQTVKLLSEKGLADHPDSSVLQQAKQSADEVLAASRALDVYIDRPARLADANIRQNAVNAVSKYSALTQLSASVDQKIDTVERLIEQENQPLDVVVRSDNKTFIKVLGVGVVGEVREKNIQLKPGTYRLEGSREGYRSVIVDVVVESSSQPIVVRVQCTERV